MPRWAGALTWRCRFAVDVGWGWSSGSWGRWRSATGRYRCGCRGPRSGPCWPTCWSTPGGWSRRTGWSRTCGGTTRRATPPTPSRGGGRARAAAGDRVGAVRLLEAALGLWRGSALAEFADQPWARAEAARLEELRLAATEALVELRLLGGGHAELVGELEALV